MKSIIPLSVAALLLAVPFASADVQETVDEATSPFDCFVPGTPLTQVVACLLEEVDPSPVVNYVMAIAEYEQAIVLATKDVVVAEATAMDVATAVYVGTTTDVAGAFVSSTQSNTMTYVGFFQGVPATATTFTMAAAHGECQFYTGANCPTAVSTRASGATAGPENCPPPAQVGYVDWATCVAFAVTTDFANHYSGVANAAISYGVGTALSTIAPTRDFVNNEGEAVDAAHRGAYWATSTYAVALAGSLDRTSEAGVDAALAQCVIVDPTLCANYDGGIFTNVVTSILP